VQYTLADFGRRGAMARQCIARKARFRLGSRSPDHRLEVVQAYLRLLAAQATSRVREEATRDAQRILDDTKARREGGVVERDAVLRPSRTVRLARQALSARRKPNARRRATLNW